jgi:hypothetical protein
MKTIHDLDITEIIAAVIADDAASQQPSKILATA